MSGFSSKRRHIVLRTSTSELFSADNTSSGLLKLSEVAHGDTVVGLIAIAGSANPTAKQSVKEMTRDFHRI